MKELIEYIARSLVDDPTQVAKADMGRVIGRSGRVANAMRSLLQVAAAQDDTRAFLNITEPE